MTVEPIRAVVSDDDNLELVTFVVCAGLNGCYLAADIVAIDAEILEVLAEREQRRRKERKCPSR